MWPYVGLTATPRLPALVLVASLRSVRGNTASIVLCTGVVIALLHCSLFLDVVQHILWSFVATTTEQLVERLGL